MSKSKSKSNSSTPMLDSLNSNEIISIKTNLLRQNCYLRDTTVNSQLDSFPPDSYVSLDEVVTDKGIELNESVQPYPITPQYVNSFVDSSDYRRDPLNAIANSSVRTNLGDITEIQDVLSMDSSQARILYNQLQERFSNAQKVDSDSSSSNTKQGGE